MSAINLYKVNFFLVHIEQTQIDETTGTSDGTKLNLAKKSAFDLRMSNGVKICPRVSF